MQELRARGIQFTQCPGLGQLVVRHNGHTADFWPASGRWRMRIHGLIHQPKAYISGLQALVQHITQQEMQLSSMGAGPVAVPNPATPPAGDYSGVPRKRKRREV